MPQPLLFLCVPTSTEAHNGFADERAIEGMLRIPLSHPMVLCMLAKACASTAPPPPQILSTIQQAPPARREAASFTVMCRRGALWCLSLLLSQPECNLRETGRDSLPTSAVTSNGPQSPWLSSSPDSVVHDKTVYNFTNANALRHKLMSRLGAIA
jgi:hypothetical protein